MEEIVWDIACQRRLSPDAGVPPPNKMSLPAGKRDRRKIMVRVCQVVRTHPSVTSFANLPCMYGYIYFLNMRKGRVVYFDASYIIRSIRFL